MSALGLDEIEVGLKNGTLSAEKAADALYAAVEANRVFPKHAPAWFLRLGLDVDRDRLHGAIWKAAVEGVAKNRFDWREVPRGIGDFNREHPDLEYPWANLRIELHKARRQYLESWLAGVSVSDLSSTNEIHEYALKCAELGRITPEEAEVLANKSGAPLPVRPKPDDLKPENEAVWDLPLVWMWIAFRSHRAVASTMAACVPGAHDWIETPWGGATLEPDSVPHIHVAATIETGLESQDTDAEVLGVPLAGVIEPDPSGALIRAHQAGKIEALGVGSNQLRERVPRAAWIDANIAFDANLVTWVTPQAGSTNAEWSDLRWYREEVEDCWPGGVKPTGAIGRGAKPTPSLDTLIREYRKLEEKNGERPTQDELVDELGERYRKKAIRSQWKNIPGARIKGEHRKSADK